MNSQNLVIIKTSKELQKLNKKRCKPVFVDAFSRQIKELFLVENPRFSANKETAFSSTEFKSFVKKKQKDFNHIYFPWNNHLVKCIKENDYFKLKTNRNRDLITASEQKKLQNYKVAVLGMSVGSNIAFVLTQAGISKEITVADFDELDTTNLNRIFGGVHQIGLNKTIMASRRIYEDNPYAKVRTLTEGVNEKNLERLLKQKKINCIVEEIDSIPVKIDVRKLAIKYKVPVLMVTDNGDGIVLHIERYDLGYKKIFHRNPSYWQKKIEGFAKNKDSAKKLAGGVIMDDMIGGSHLVDPKMLKSVKKVLNNKLVSWSQLGSAAMLGGVYATYAIKQIALRKDKKIETRSHIFPKY